MCWLNCQEPAAQGKPQPPTARLADVGETRGVRLKAWQAFVATENQRTQPLRASVRDRRQFIRLHLEQTAIANNPQITAPVLEQLRREVVHQTVRSREARKFSILQPP